jgi:hypothetical protein
MDAIHPGQAEAPNIVPGGAAPALGGAETMTGAACRRPLVRSAGVAQPARSQNVRL